MLPEELPLLVADESVDFNIVRTLRTIGYEVYSIQESNSGISDVEVLAISTQRKALLITEDKDFGEIVFKEKTSSLRISFDPVRYQNRARKTI